MKKLENEYLNEKYVEVYHENEEEIKFNAPHNFYVTTSGTNMSEVSHEVIITGDEESVFTFPCAIHFQEGPIKEVGINGVTNEQLIAMVICRLEYFQKSKFGGRENAVAITKLEESLMWLNKRNLKRNYRTAEAERKR